MLALSFSAGMLGIEGYVVRVEADSSAGSPVFTIIGLPDRALGEARERVRAAIFNSGFSYPAGRLLVNLSPADVRKEGPAFDLAIALALLAIDEQIDRLALQEFVALGELALDGRLNATAGILPMLLGARNGGFTKIIAPSANVEEALLVEGLELFAVTSLSEAVAIVQGHGAKHRVQRGAATTPVRAAGRSGDYADVRGQNGAKRALEIAAAGGHNLLLVGPPGCGKTMLAQRLPSILPPMSSNEALDVTKIYSVAGLLGPVPRLVAERPFRSPHHTISEVALVGGGAVPKPGEISLAHHGVLFLDELPEFRRSALEVMRQPIEDGTVTIARAAGTFNYPARFMLVASMNPCPCGMRGTRDGDCRCDDAIVAKYVAKLSGPLLDRIDLQIEVGRITFTEMHERTAAEPSSNIRARIVSARDLQRARYRTLGIENNGQLAPAQVRVFCALDDEAASLLRDACAKRQFSARAFDRIARVARTIADLANCDTIARDHVAEAIRYRSLERIGTRRVA